MIISDLFVIRVVIVTIIITTITTITVITITTNDHSHKKAIAKTTNKSLCSALIVQTFQLALLAQIKLRR